MDGTNKYTFTVSEKAVKAIKAALEKRDTPDAALRVGVRGGGCSGYMYVIEFSDSPAREKRDLVFEFDGVKVHIDKKSILYLNECELDWEETLMKRGFKFNNPLVKKNCGCDLSFEV